MKKNYLTIVEINKIIDAMDNDKWDCYDREIIKICLIYECCYGNPHNFVEEDGSIKDGKKLSDVYAIYEYIIRETDFFNEKKDIKNIETLENLINAKFGIVGMFDILLNSIQKKMNDLEENISKIDLTKIGELINANNKE